MIRGTTTAESKRLDGWLATTFSDKIIWYLSDNHFTQRDIAELNIPSNNPIIVQVANTKNLTKDILARITNPNVLISVLGGFNYMAKDKRLENGNIRRTLHGPQRLSRIIQEFEKIEKGINPKWSDEQKAFYYFMNLVSKLNYSDEKDCDGETPSDEKFVSLRALLGGEAICAGFAQIFKEAMDRLDIPCELQGKTGHHDWCVVQLGGKHYLVDVSDAACYKKEKLNPTLDIKKIAYCFGTKEGGSTYNKHHNLDGEREERKYNLSYFTPEHVDYLYNSVLSDINNRNTGRTA